MKTNHQHLIANFIKALLFALLGGTAALAQTIRIADNNPTAPTGVNIYRGATALQDAIDAAAVDDIVYVQPSMTSYGNVVIRKRITLRGIGFNTGKDLGLESLTGYIGLTNTLDNTSNASGTLIEGIRAIGDSRIYIGYKEGTFDYVLRDITISNCILGENGITRGGAYMPVENLTIRNCFTGILFEPTGSVTNLLVTQSFLYQLSLSYNFSGGPGGSLTSAIFSNNIIDRGNTNSFGRSGGGAYMVISSLIITNNNFLGENDITGSRLVRTDLHDAIVSNNIFYGCAPITTSTYEPFERNVFSNNLSFGTSNDLLPPAGTGVGNTGSNNIQSQDPKFENAAFNALWTATMNFNLQSSSPAKNAGTDGTDIGITGGAYPITTSNISLKPTSVPVMMSLNPAALVPQNQPLKTNIKAKSN